MLTTFPKTHAKLGELLDFVKRLEQYVGDCDVFATGDLDSIVRYTNEVAEAFHTENIKMKVDSIISDIEDFLDYVPLFGIVEILEGYRKCDVGFYLEDAIETPKAMLDAIYAYSEYFYDSADHTLEEFYNADVFVIDPTKTFTTDFGRDLQVIQPFKEDELREIVKDYVPDILKEDPSILEVIDPNLDKLVKEYKALTM